MLIFLSDKNITLNGQGRYRLIKERGNIVSSFDHKFIAEHKINNIVNKYI